MPYYLFRLTPLHDWQVVTERLAEGEVIDLDVQFWSQAKAEADQMNGKQDGRQESLPI